MRALLDTHTFLWWNLDDPQISSVAREFISDGTNEVFLSAASAWEIAIKCARGRLVLPETPDKYVASRVSLHHFLPLPVQLSHALHVFNLPDIHQDPFDRLLVAQSQLERLPILTSDPEIIRYEVDIIW
jgi:PIN domain nuclease of toxin-antitoxin system